MAEATFNDVLNEQKQTTSTLARLGESLREQLLGSDESRDKGEESREKNEQKSREKNESRVIAGKKAWQTRQNNLDKQTSWLSKMADSLSFLPFMGKSTESAAKKKEGDKDKESFLKKTFGKLGDTFKDGFKGMMGILGKFKTTAMTGLMAFLPAAGLFALIEFLQSKEWKKMIL